MSRSGKSFRSDIRSVHQFEPMCLEDQIGSSDDLSQYLRVVKNCKNKAKLQLIIKNGKNHPKYQVLTIFLTFRTPPDVIWYYFLKLLDFLKLLVQSTQK